MEPGYSNGIWRGQEHFECLECAYDTFSEDDMLSHCQTRRHGYPSVPHLSDKEYIATEMGKPPSGVMITLGCICWNTKAVTVDAVRALLVESNRLRELGCRSTVVVFDNGSDDGTAGAILEGFNGCMQAGSLSLLSASHNTGISAARNKIIQCALAIKSDYLLMIDGDIQVIPFSTYAMARYLHTRPEVGCIGAYSSSCTTEIAKASKRLQYIEDKFVHDDIDIAWTQYGLFQCQMLKMIQFDEGGPFGQPGWGFEDNDLYFQMREVGFESRYFCGVRYLHRNRLSSWPNLKKSGVSVESRFKERRDFLVNKWAQRGLDGAKLQNIRALQLPG